MRTEKKLVMISASFRGKHVVRFVMGEYNPLTKKTTVDVSFFDKMYTDLGVKIGDTVSVG